MMKEENDLKERTKQFALRFIRLFGSLPKSIEAQILGKQLLRSGTSVGASSDELTQFTDIVSTGTKMPRTNWSEISSFKVALPPKPIAAAFTHTIQPMLDRIHANLHQSRTLATLCDTLLPKLLSGAEMEMEAVH